MSGNSSHEFKTDESFLRDEQELVNALTGNDDGTQKRHVLRLFDRFRAEYTKISSILHENLREQRQIMERCLAMKNELVVNAMRIQADKKIRAQEAQSLLFYREECQNAWREAQLSKEREKEALRIIDQLRSEIDRLQMQVNNLTNDLICRQSDPAEQETLDAFTTRSTFSSSRGHSRESPSRHGGTTAHGHAAANGHDLDDNNANLSLSFNDWKQLNRVWSPTKRAATVPTTKSQPFNTRSASTSSLTTATPMERAVATTIPTMRRHKTSNVTSESIEASASRKPSARKPGQLPLVPKPDAAYKL